MAIKKVYMVYVEGGRVPTYHHEREYLSNKDAEKSATREAKRLAELPENQGKSVHVLCSVYAVSCVMLPQVYELPLLEDYPSPEASTVYGSYLQSTRK